MKQHPRVLVLATAAVALGLGGPGTRAAVAAPAPDAAFTPTELGTLSSVATVTDATALAINPAAMAFQLGGDLFASRSVNGNDQTNLFLTGGGFGTGWQQFRSAGRFLNSFTLGSGAQLGAGLAVGGTFSYLQFLDGQGGNSANFGLSALYRPTSWLSAGLSVQNLSGPPVGAFTLRRGYRGGVAVRPLGDRITVSLDGLYAEGDPATAITPILGLQAELLPGLRLRGQLDNQLQYSLGLGMNFGHVEVGGMSGVNRGRVGESDLAYVSTSDLANRQALDFSRPHVAYVRLEGDLQDGPLSALDLRQEFYPGVLHITQRFTQAKSDPKVTGLVLDMRGVRPGLALIQEVRRAIEDFKTSGKPVVAYVQDPSMPEFYLACSADKVIMHPAGGLDMTGVANGATFFKGLFEKLGVQPQFVGIGKYKSAPEQYMRKGFSEPAREQNQALIDDQFNQMVAGIAKARRLSTDEVKALVNKGLFMPTAAKEKNLIDAISYPDQVPGFLEKGPAPAYPLKVYKPATWGNPDVIAVVNLNGAISRGTSGGDLLNGATSGSGTLTYALREIRKDDMVKAVVIRVDSPGGDSLASDEIGREIDLLRLADKPVIISMGDVAASGGYWVAANGTRIYCEPGTITGSIGVFTGQFAIGQLLAKLGISSETLKRGEHADMNQGLRPLTPEELGMLKEQARYTYGQFLERVAQGRRMSTSRVDEIAQGRVWSGERALDIGLVDKFGGLETAIEDARQEAKLDATTTILDFYPKPGTVIQSLVESNMEEQLKRTVESARRYQKVSNWLLMPPLESAR